MLDLLITRHGRTGAGEVMLGGQLDVPLAPEGRAEADALARRLAGVRIDRIISSPMLRAIETAQAIATGRPIEIDDRLRELDYGRWESLSYDEIDAHRSGASGAVGTRSGVDALAGRRVGRRRRGAGAPLPGRPAGV